MCWTRQWFAGLMLVLLVAGVGRANDAGQTADLCARVNGWYGVLKPDDQGHGPGVQLPLGAMQPATAA